MRRIGPSESPGRCCASPTCLSTPSRETSRAVSAPAGSPGPSSRCSSCCCDTRQVLSANASSRSVGLRLPDHRQLARGLRRLPAAQDRGSQRAAADPHRPRHRLRRPGNPAVTGLQARIARQPLRRRVGVLAALGVGLAVLVTATAAYITVRMQLTRSVDDSLLDRARQAVGSSSGTRRSLVGCQQSRSSSPTFVSPRPRRWGGVRGPR